MQNVNGVFQRKRFLRALRIVKMCWKLPVLTLFLIFVSALQSFKTGNSSILTKGFVAAERCWCAWRGQTTSPLSRNYWSCERCGTLYSKIRLKPSAIAEFYSYRGYWHERQKSKAHPVLEERRQLLESDGRRQKWLEVIGRHTSPDSGLAVEMGCAEGTLLLALREAGWKTLGVEPDPQTVGIIREATGLDIRAGIFPGIDLPPASLFVACDVLEHAPDPVAFLKAAHDLLLPDGVIFLQLPILEDEKGFGVMDSRVFDAQEHSFIFTRSSLAAILGLCGFEVLENYDAWSMAHEITVAKKREQVIPKESKHLANLGEAFSPRFTQFVDSLNELADPLGLRTFCNWSKIWEYPWVWENGLKNLDWKGLRVLDIGSERSPWPWFLSRLGAQVTLVEATANFVEQWEAVRQKLDVSVQWKVSDSCALPVPSGHFDVVTSLSVLEHQSDRSQALAEVARVLKPGGLFAITCDICEQRYDMTYPSWGGVPLTLQQFEQEIWLHPAFEQQAPLDWNKEDIPAFLDWHRQSAPHHNYTCAAALLRKRTNDSWWTRLKRRLS